MVGEARNINSTHLTKEQVSKIKKATKYIENNPEPLQKLCPEIIQKWKSAKGNVYYSNKTGKRGGNVFSVMSGKTEEYERATTSYEYEGFYIHYINKLDALEFSAIVMDGNRGKDGEKRNWKFPTRYYLKRWICFRNDANIYSVDVMVEGGKYWNKNLIDYIGEHMSGPQARTKICEEIKKFDSSATFTDYEGTPISSPWLWAVRKWYKKNFIPRTPKTQQTNEILNETLAPVNFRVINQGGETYLTSFFQKINDDWFVFRISDVSWDTLTRTYNGLQERLRIYVPNNTKDKIMIMYRHGETYHKINTSANNIYCYTKDYRNKLIGEELLEECIRTKYLKSIINWESCKFFRDFVNIIRHPMYEQLLKMGYKNITKEIIESGITPSLRDYFYTKERKLPVLKMLGVSKYILDKVENMYDGSGHRYFTNYLQSVRELKKLFGDDLSSLSKETIEKYSFLFTTAFVDHFYKGFDSILDSWCRQQSFSYDDEQKRNIKKIVNLVSKQTSLEKKMEVLNLFKDIRNTYSRIRRDIDIDINDYRNVNDLHIIHDNLVEIQVLEQAERTARYNAERAKELEEQKKEFDKLQEDRIKNYEVIGDKYSVIVPKELNDLIVEGAILHHCVGGYVRDHANGETNILFLRKTNEIDTPFYTVEVKNNQVIQVHGSHNKWLGNDPDAIPFLYKYFVDKGFRFDKKVLLNLGAGYGASNESLDDSYLVGVA